jgi:excisionase family DNA binding protein
MPRIARAIFALLCVGLLILCGGHPHAGHGGLAVLLAGITETDVITASIQEFIRISGLGNTTIYKLLNDGELESVNVGRRRLILIDSYRRYLKRHSGKPAAAPLANPPIGRGRAVRPAEAAQR